MGDLYFPAIPVVIKYESRHSGPPKKPFANNPSYAVAAPIDYDGDRKWPARRGHRVTTHNAPQQISKEPLRKAKQARAVHRYRTNAHTGKTLNAGARKRKKNSGERQICPKRCIGERQLPV